MPLGRTREGGRRESAWLSRLFEPLTLRGVTLRNRIVVSPMCQYSSEDGFATDWHLVHLGSRAVGGAGLVFTEAAAVEPRGRISAMDLGIWLDEHVEMLARVNRFIEAQGSIGATQLAHAGRKGSVGPPWDPKRGEVSLEDGGWIPLAPTAEKDMPHYPLPHAMERGEIEEIVQAFADGARRSDEAGYAVTEIHGAHGYLLHEFLSPLANKRTDEYGGSFENRSRFLRETVDAVRAVWPERKPLFVRLSATDWLEGGWSVEETIELARMLGPRGVDVFDISSGGISRSPLGQSAEAPCYQVPFAARVRNEAGVKTVAVGVINSAPEAEAVLTGGAADLVAIARKSLGDPYFPYRAANALGTELAWPRQYRRALV